jgi:predicted acetyltransferase
MKNEFNLRTMIVVTLNDEIVGFSEFVFSNEFSKDLDIDCELCGLYIKNGYKHLGLGSIVFEYVKNLFKENNKKKMGLWCVKENEPAISFYKKKGGEFTKEKTFTIADKEYSEIAMYAPVYYVEDEDDCFVYVSGTWISLSAELQMQNGGAITDISQATTSYHYYALVDNGWKEYFAPEGSVTIVANGTFDVKEKAEVVVNVENKIPDGYIKPSGNLEITENGTFDVTDKSSVTIEVESESTGGDAIIQVDNIGGRYGFKVDLGDIALPYTTTQINNIRIEEA